jgi:signal transduction histidine kinase
MSNESLSDARILMVDDVVSSLCLLENVLNRLRFKNVRTLTDPTRIMAVFEEFKPDLVITDIVMPQLDGIELVTMLRSHLKDECLPILVLTGHSDPQQKRRALAAGATDIMSKPFDSAEIQMRIRAMLQMRFQRLQIEDDNRMLEARVAERTVELEKALAALKDSQGQVLRQERIRAFGDMAGGVVHDFNNALMSILGYSDLLLKNPKMADDRTVLQKYMKSINEAGRDASQVVSRLRDFYRPREESDVFTSVELNRLIEEVVPMTKPKWHNQALGTGRSIQVKLELQKIPAVMGNSAELREVFTNLIFNAVDAMPEGGTITLRSECTEEAVKIEVADTGVGMTDEIRNRCLEPYFSTKAEQGGGGGLGLSVTYGILRRHSGTLEIETSPGRGTTLRMTFPTPHHSSGESNDARITHEHTLKVLVVDDDAIARDVVTKYLRTDGHRVATANNGGEAMQQVMREDFDVVIAGHGMPGMSGVQLADAVRQVDPEKRVFLLTGFGMDRADKPASVDYILKKPLEQCELRAALQSAGRSAGGMTMMTGAETPAAA